MLSNREQLEFSLCLFFFFWSAQLIWGMKRAGANSRTAGAASHGVGAALSGCRVELSDEGTGSSRKSWRPALLCSIHLSSSQSVSQPHLLSIYNLQFRSTKPPMSGGAVKQSSVWKHLRRTTQRAARERGVGATTRESGSRWEVWFLMNCFGTTQPPLLLYSRLVDWGRF